MTADPSRTRRASDAAVEPAASAATVQAITGPTAPADSSSTWLGGGVLLVALGVALVLLRWGARRLA